MKRVNLLAADLKQALDAQLYGNRLAADLLAHLNALPSTSRNTEVIDMPGKNYPGKDNIKRETPPADHPALGQPATHEPTPAGKATGPSQTKQTPPGVDG